MPDSVDLAASSLRLDRLPPTPRRLLERLRDHGEETSIRLWWVGGGVRDLLLERPRGSADLDLVVEEDPAPIARGLATRFRGELRLHPEFLTASVVLPDGGRIDLARSRSESYPAPGALPRVAPTDLASDLERRDFSVNAIAARVAPAPHEVLDPCSGRADLESRRLRVLHDRSFLDDPTRILRGVRFAVRLGFELEPATDRLARNAVRDGALETLSRERLERELDLSFESHGTALATLGRLTDLGIDLALGANRPDPALRERLERALSWAERTDWSAAGIERPSPWPIVRLALLSRSSGAGRATLLGRLSGAAGAGDLLRQLERLESAEPVVGSGDALPHTVCRHLESVGPAALAWIASAGADAAARVLDHLLVHRKLELAVTGGDLVAAGIPPGPAVGTALRRTREARLDGRIPRERELEFALRVARGEGTQ